MLIVALLPVIIFRPSYVAGEQPNQTKTTLYISSSGPNLIFSGRTIPNAIVTIQIWFGAGCWVPGASLANFTTHSNSTGLYETIPPANGGVTVGSYSAVASATSTNPYSFSNSGCVLFLLYSPVPEFSEPILTSVIVLAITYLIIAKKKT